IGRREAIEWPPRSLGFSLLNYFLWGLLKSTVYKTKPQNLDDLRQRILDETALICRDHI
ncbi:hypothetical protein EAI_13380, partial [Harpegnathos saltator]